MATPNADDPKVEMKSRSRIIEALVPVSATVKSHELTRPLMFVQGNVKQLRESHFALDTRELVALNYDDCIIVLFYMDNRESTRLVKIWATVSSQVSGAMFAACHLSLEKRVAENFSRLNMDPNHPFYWCRLQQYPFILVYRRGWPAAFYNGERSTQALMDYTLTLACRAEYHERIQRFYSAQAENNIEMSGIRPHRVKRYGGFVVPPKVRSSDFRVEQPIRGYAASLPVKLVERQEILSSAIMDPTKVNKVASNPSPEVATKREPVSNIAAPIL